MTGKAQFISFTTLALFSALLLMYYAFSENNLNFNDLTVKSIISEELIYQNNIIFTALDQALNAEYYIINTTNILMRSVISNNMNPLNNVSSFISSLPVYNTMIQAGITYNFNQLITDLNRGRYERIINPTGNTIIFNYNDNHIRITSASSVKEYTFVLNCTAPITSITWNTNPPTGYDVQINYVHYNGTVSTYYLINSRNNECAITCNGEELIINYNFRGQNRIQINYDDITRMDFSVKLSFDTVYGNVFKISSPYSLTNVALKYKEYEVSKGFE